MTTRIRMQIDLSLNKNLPFRVLQILTNNEGMWVQNHNAPPEVLASLCTHQASLVRGAVALNPNTTVEVLERLSRDDAWEVRCAVAQQPHTPAEVLDRLRLDQNPHVRRHATECIGGGVG